MPTTDASEAATALRAGDADASDTSARDHGVDLTASGRAAGPIAVGPADDAVVALLVATAVGFVEAGIRVGALTRLREFANGEVHVLEQACSSARHWPYLSPEARAAAIRLLTAAARR